MVGGCKVPLVPRLSQGAAKHLFFLVEQQSEGVSKAGLAPAYKLALAGTPVQADRTSIFFRRKVNIRRCHEFWSSSKNKVRRCEKFSVMF